MDMGVYAVDTFVQAHDGLNEDVMRTFCGLLARDRKAARTISEVARAGKRLGTRSEVKPFVYRHPCLGQLGGPLSDVSSGVQRLALEQPQKKMITGSNL